jgi:3-oxoacyl-[acyl-carrier protein] reductase
MIGEGRVAVVTGGGRGIGRAIAVRLAGEGAQIAISYRSNDAAAKEAAEEVRGAGVRCELFKGDVAEPDDVKALFDGATEAFGRVDILVNNAGVTRDNLMMRMKEEEFDDVLRTNLKGTYLCGRWFGPGGAGSSTSPPSSGSSGTPGRQTTRRPRPGS